MKRSRALFFCGGLLLSLILLLAIAGPWIARDEAGAMDLARALEGPSSENWLGRDENGADVLSSLARGARVSLSVSISVVAISFAIGIVVGSIAGYRGGRTDQILMRAVDMFYAFPGFLLALALVAVLGPGTGNLILAMSITSWTGFARLTRGEILHLKERDFIQSAAAIGASPWRIVTLHLWPNLVGPLSVHAASVTAAAVIAESGLSFLGLGVPPGTPTWGGLLSSGRRVLVEAPHLSLAPGLCLVLLVLAFNLLGDGVRERLDPRRAKNKI